MKLKELFKGKKASSAKLSKTQILDSKQLEGVIGGADLSTPIDTTSNRVAKVDGFSVKTR